MRKMPLNIRFQEIRFPEDCEDFFSCIISSSKIDNYIILNSNLKTDSYNSELDQSDTEFDPYHKYKNECGNNKDIQSIGEEYIEVESNEVDFPLDRLTFKKIRREST